MISVECILLFVVALIYCSRLSNCFYKPLKYSGKIDVVYSSKKNWDAPKEVPSESIIDNTNGITYQIEMSRNSGISWGSDLSFRWVYVLGLDENGEAAASNIIEKGDYIIGVGNTSLIAQDFDYVLTTFAKLPRVSNYTFFRGKKDQLMGTPVLNPSETIVTVTVVEDGKPVRVFQCPGGTNLRTLLVSNGINVYRSLTRWTNCNGKQRCGTCIVEMEQGGEYCSRRALDEEAVLSENPESYRLSCVTSVYGNVTVKVQGPVGAAQWTR
eukprot:gene5320-7385_t